MKRLRRIALTLVFSVLLASQALALSIGTFNIEYFNTSGKKAYSPTDCKALAQTIKSSGADVLALQEIEGNATMRYFVTKFMPGWKFKGNDTGRRQDLFFLWNTKTIKLLKGPTPYYSNASFRYGSKTLKLFTRPPLMATFRDTEKGQKFTLINIHLKSQSTRGKKDKAEGVRYNNAKRDAQMGKVEKLASTLRDPVFILGDYNIDEIKTTFPKLTLSGGRYSYDNMRSNLDHIGYININRASTWKLYEVESSIPARSSNRSQHPDHDIVVLSLDGDVPQIAIGGIVAPQVVKPQKVTASDSPAPSGASGDTIVYITKTGKCYHRGNCSSLRKSKISITLKEAKEQGYRACKRCHPPK